MLAKTHAAVGEAAVLYMIHPTSVTGLVLGSCAALIGSLIPDIDAGTSQSRKTAETIITFLAALVGLTGIAEYFLHIGIQEMIQRESSLVRVFPSVLLFIVLCMFGMEQPHRSFMHSLLGCFLLNGCVTAFLPSLSPCFLTGYLSHLGIDILNRRGERLLYPLKKGFCLRVCDSDGLVNRLLFLAGGAVCIYESVTIFTGMV